MLFRSVASKPSMTGIWPSMKMQSNWFSARFRTFAEKAVTEGRISPKERREILDLFREGLAGYTYFES